jgi:hypothetical protein
MMMRRKGGGRKEEVETLHPSFSLSFSFSLSISRLRFHYLQDVPELSPIWNITANEASFI